MDKENCEHKNTFGTNKEEICLDCKKSIWSLDLDLEKEKSQKVNKF